METIDLKAIPGGDKKPIDVYAYIRKLEEWRRKSMECVLVVK